MIKSFIRKIKKINLKSDLLLTNTELILTKNPEEIEEKELSPEDQEKLENGKQ